MRIRSTGEYPCNWDDLINEKGEVIATIYALRDKDKRKPGIKKAKDGVYDILVFSNEINNEVVRKALENLSKKTGKQYEFCAEPTTEDKLIQYADKLIALGYKYRNRRGEYDFSRARTPKEKARVIKSWIGEILYEAVTNKDRKAVKSLVDCIETEIHEMMKK